MKQLFLHLKPPNLPWHVFCLFLGCLITVPKYTLNNLSTHTKILASLIKGRAYAGVDIKCTDSGPVNRPPSHNSRGRIDLGATERRALWRAFTNTWPGARKVCTGSPGGCNPTKSFVKQIFNSKGKCLIYTPASGWVFCICYFYNISEVALCYCSYQWRKSKAGFLPSP